MRPRLREDVRYIPCPGGVYLHSEGAVCTLEGTTLHTWLTRLQPFLTGDHTLDELTEALPENQRDTVDKLVRTLHAQGFVIDALADRPHSLTEVERQIYAEEISFVRYSMDSAEYRFQRYREARVTLLGSGPVLIALLDAGLRSGSRRFHIVGCGPEDVPQLQQVVQRVRRDGAQEIEIDHSMSITSKTVTDLVEASDVVLQVCAPGDWADLTTVARECAQPNTVLGQVLVDQNEAWISPVDHSCAESGWRRLRALRFGHSDENTGEEDEQQVNWLTGPVPAVIAAQVTLACFCRLTGIDQLPRYAGQASGPVMTRIDLKTLDTRTHKFMAHPLAALAGAPSAREACATIEAYVSGPPVSPMELLDQSERLVDPRCGLFGWLDEDDLAQLPLWVCRASVSDPCCLLPSWAPVPVVTGYGLARDEARLQTLLAAFAAYGSLAVDRRRITDTGATGGVGRTPGKWGMDLTTGRPKAVPAAVAMPVLNGVTVPYQAPVGAAAGLTWNAAVSAALRQHCELLLIQRLAVADRPFPMLDPSHLRDERVFRLLRLLAAAREQAEIYDLRGLLGVPACAVLTSGVTVAITCGTTMINAVTTGLERTLLSWQARHTSQPDYAPSTVPQLGERLRAPAVSESPATEEVGITILVDALQAAGQTPVVMPLDHDVEATRILPYVAQVVLCRD